ncbi:MAG TPA: DNA mismatch repair protein MutT, partial [Aeromicrobium sp.]|nr:DNA mismatch repair protein MutT [Aeromicrobium sp.]
AEFLAPQGDPWPISDEFEMRLWFTIVAEGDPVAGDSHDELKWLHADSLKSVDWLDADKQVLTHLLRSL